MAYAEAARPLFVGESSWDDRASAAIHADLAQNWAFADDTARLGLREICTRQVDHEPIWS